MKPSISDSFSLDAVILAGGLGTRLAPVVSNVPKALAPIKGKAFIIWQLENLSNLGVSRFHLALGFRAEEIIDEISRSVFRERVSVSIESEPKGTGGALINVAKNTELPPTVLVVNGDTISEVDLPGLWNQHSLQKSDLTLVAAKPPGGNRFGHIVRTRVGEFEEIREGVGCVGCEHRVDSGVYLLESKLLKDSEDEAPSVSLTSDLVPSWVARKASIGVFDVDSPFLDIGTPSDFLSADTSPFFQEPQPRSISDEKTQ